MLASDGVDDSEVPLRADDHQNEDGSGVAQRVGELVHLAEEIAENPAEMQTNTSNVS